MVKRVPTAGDAKRLVEEEAVRLIRKLLTGAAKTNDTTMRSAERNDTSLHQRLGEVVEAVATAGPPIGSSKASLRERSRLLRQSGTQIERALTEGPNALSSGWRIARGIDALRVAVKLWEEMDYGNPWKAVGWGTETVHEQHEQYIDIRWDNFVISGTRADFLGFLDASSQVDARAREVISQIMPEKPEAGAGVVRAPVNPATEAAV